LFCQDSQRCFLIFFSKNEQFQFSFFFCNIIVRNNIMCVWTCIRWPCVVCFCCRIGSGFLTNSIIDILFFFFYMYIICTAYCVVCSNVVCILKSSCSSRPIVFSGNKNGVVFLGFFLIFLARILRVVGN